KNASRSIPAVNRVTFSQAVAISERYVCQSRDMDEILLDSRSHLGAESVGCTQVDGTVQQVLEVELQAHEAVKIGPPLERDQDIHVAPFPIVPARHRAEYGERPEPVLLPKDGGFGAQTVEDGLAVHGGISRRGIVWLRIPCAATDRGSRSYPGA